jgi:aminopeptidase N
MQLAMALHDDWQWAFEAHQDNGAYHPTRCPAAAAPWPAWRWTCCAWRHRQRRQRLARQGLPAFQGRRQHDRPLQRAGALVGSGHELAAPALAALPRLFKDEPWCWTSGLRCRPAPDRGGNVLPVVRQLMRTRLQPAQPQPRAQRDLQLLQRQPGRFHRATRPAMCSGASACWSWTHQPAGRRPPGARLDRWKKLAEPYRSAAREAIARVAAKTDLSNDVREVAHPRAWPTPRPVTPDTELKDSMAKISLTRYLVEQQRVDGHSRRSCACCSKWWRAPARASARPSTKAPGRRAGFGRAARTCRARCRRSWTSSPTRC